MTTNRLFVALDLNKAHYKALAKYRDRHGKIPYLRFVHPKNFHITALFIGTVPEAALPDVKSALADVAYDCRPFSLTLQNVIYAPPNKPSNMVWARYAAHEAFTALCRRLSQELSYCEPEEPKPLPHVTLARFKERVQPRKLVKLARPEPLAPLTIETLTLYQSELSPGGSTYTPLARLPFGESAGMNAE